MTIKAAALGNEVFLQGTYLSLGLSSSGTIGTREAAPGGFQSYKEGGYLRVGLYADVDGFGTGKVTTLRDAVLPGLAVEGFTVGYKQDGTLYRDANYDIVGRRDIAGTSSYSATADAAQAKWQGTTTEKLAISQTATLVDDGKFIRFDVTLANKSGEAMADVRYMRTIDTDQGSSFSTLNQIVEQGNGKALVSSSAIGGSSPAFLYADDPRAVASIFGFKNYDPYAALAHDTPQAKGTSVTADMSINLTFEVGTLAAGKSTTMTFYVGVTDNLAKTISDIVASGPSPSPSPAPTPTPEIAPDAINDSFATAYNTAVKGSVLSNDKDADGDTLTAALVTGPANGALTLNTDGTFTYIAKSGFSGTDSFVYKATDGTLSDTATARITVGARPNAAPDAINDSFATAYNTALKGSVLVNDKDADGNALTASLVTGPANGTVNLNTDGTFTYTAKSGFSGTDSFVYMAKDSTLSDTATATVKVDGPAVSTPLDRAHSIDLSAATGQSVVGKAGHESFFVDISAASGRDLVKAFGTNDVLLTTKALLDGNKDGIIAFSTGTMLALDGAKSKDTITFDGDTDALRFLGQTKAGLSVYADEDVRPFKAVEGKLSNDVLSGSGTVAKTTTFFFDTALDVDLGTDKLVKFGAKDLVVTTTEINSTNGKITADGSGYFALPGGDDRYVAGEGGYVAISDVGGKAVTALEFDGAVSHDGVQYFVYSQVGSAIGTYDLVF